MQIAVPLEGGKLAAKYTKHAAASDKQAGVPVRSFPITITGAPATTKTFALQLIDYDSVPVCGFVWLHWLAANIPATTTTIPEDASRTHSIPLVQGKNSSASPLFNRDAAIHVGYTGPQPPTGVHDYRLTVYAVDCELPLAEGFWYNEFKQALAEHVVARATIALPAEA